MKLDQLTQQIFLVAQNEARLQSHEYVTPEHYLYATLMFGLGQDIAESSGADVGELKSALQRYFDDRVPRVVNVLPRESFAFERVLAFAAEQAAASARNEVSIGDFFAGLFALPESVGAYLLERSGADRVSVLRYISHGLKDKQEQANRPRQGSDADKEFLSKYAVNLTERARRGKFDPAVKREDVTDRIILTLCRRAKNNPVLVGDPGVGKTAIVEAFAKRVADDDVPRMLRGANIFEVDMAAVVAGTRYRGDFEERLTKILSVISKYPNAIVCLDEIHNVVGGGAAGGSMDAAGILKPYLTRQGLRFIGCTTYDEYKKRFEKDAALTRRFQKVDVTEPDGDACFEMLKAIRERYEVYHGVAIDDETLRQCVELSVKYINGRALPDKAVDALDEACASARINAESGGGELAMVAVTVSDVERVVAKMSNVEPSAVKGGETADLLNLEERLSGAVFGQSAAIRAVTDAVKAYGAGLTRKDKPVCSLLFVGPTGVGKTELAKQLAAALNVGFIRFDMSEYQEQHSVARLIGSPPGYVGYEEGGLLTDALRKTPRCVLLLDEIEKAHHDVYNVLLQVMDYGRLTDNAGRKADFRNAAVIMTSNAGAAALERQTVGFGNENPDGKALNKEVERVFSPEFRNRLDDIVRFNPVDADMAGRIARKALDEMAALMGETGKVLRYDDAAAGYVAEKGLSRVYGAREIARVVDKEARKKLTDAVLSGGTVFDLTIKDGELTVLCE